VQWIDLLTHSQPLYLGCVAILGLIMGSFLNVLIYRLPKMLERDWTKQCVSFLVEHNQLAENAFSPQSDVQPFNLMTPRSRCPYCQHQISALENIPVFSFLVLRGKCRACHHAISWRYPIIEILTAIFSVLTAMHFGFSWQALFALILTWMLIAISVIDLDHQIIPDDIALPLLWLGLAVNIQHTFTDLTSATIGAMAGYLSLWCVYWLFKLITHKEGMGYGDFKLLAMLGAWLGWQVLPIIVLLSSFVGAVVGLSLILFRRLQRTQPIPFGPFLAIAGWLSLIFGDKIVQYYLHYAGLT
jgi:leader peptidase (prepilin peptidase)/N-methyltransferase